MLSDHMGKRRKKEKEKPQKKRKLLKSHVSCKSTKQGNFKSVQAPASDSTVCAEEGHLDIYSVKASEEDWMMQTSSGYEYDFTYEHQTCLHSWEPNKVTHGEASSAIWEETKLNHGKASEMDKDRKEKLTDTKVESREERIKSLKALLSKQEKALSKLRPDADKLKHAQTQCSVATSADVKGKKSRSSPTAEVKKYSKGRKSRRSRKKAESCTSPIVNTRDVDIWMSKGDLITKDEFLAVVGLIRVPKLY